jgi:uncharacterized membrane protein YeaQ/YmgE (transglycosylase-associated protein family)
MLWLIWTAIVGLIVGVIAKAMMPGEDPGGVIMTILLGIGGAFVGRIIAGFLGVWGYSGIASLLFSVLGAVVILWIYRKFFRKDEVLV